MAALSEQGTRAQQPIEGCYMSHTTNKLGTVQCPTFGKNVDLTVQGSPGVAVCLQMDCEANRRPPIVLIGFAHLGMGR